MVKVIDIDALFDNYISDYVYKNIGKIKPEEIEDNIPKLYEEFGKKELKELDGFSPETYYENYTTAELLMCLKSHIEKGVSVPDFLCEALNKRKKDENEFIKLLEQTKNDEFLVYLMNILFDMDIVPVNIYVEFIVLNYPETISELATEFLCKRADEAKDLILSQFDQVDEGKKEMFCEVLSYCKKDDKVFNLLIVQFAKNKNRTQLYSSYLARFGDERALPFLLKATEEPKISYADFEELRYAIEALGGVCDKTRDFSNDKSFKIIKSSDKKNWLMLE